MLSDESRQALASKLYQALRSNKPIPPVTEQEPRITIEDAYHVSQCMLDHRLSKDGEKVVGKKIGVTSKSVQDMLNVYQPDFGFLTNVMEYPEGAEIPIRGNLIAPRAEGEIAFKLRKDLLGPGITEKAVLEATDVIVPCFEIVDSRIADWNIKIEDTVADNASCGAYVLGLSEVDPRDVDLASLKMKVYLNDSLNCEGISSAVQGNPLSAVAWLANTLGEFGISLKAGEVILSGSLVPLIPVKPGDHVRLDLEHVGSASCRFV